MGNLRRDQGHFLMFRVSHLTNPIRFSVRAPAWSLVALSELGHTGIGVMLWWGPCFWGQQEARRSKMLEKTPKHCLIDCGGEHHNDVCWSHRAGDEAQSISAEEVEAVWVSPSSLGHSAFPKQRQCYHPGSNKSLANQAAERRAPRSVK